MRETTAPPSQGIYRTAARTTADPPPPRWPALLDPLWGAAKCLLVVLVPPILFNLLVAPQILSSSYGEGRLVPAFDFAEDKLAIAALGSVVALAFVGGRRVRPLWRGMRLRAKVPYVAALVGAQLLLVAVGEGVLLETRGGLKLFEPRYLSTSIGPNLRTAYVYENGFLGCSYEVYVADPLQPVMKPTSKIVRRVCSSPAPTIDWSEGSPRLVDGAGQPLEDEDVPPLFGWGGGC